MSNETLTVKINKVFKVFSASEAIIRPHFILTGPSGSGKSHTIKTLVEKEGLGYMEINAAQLTKEGTSGNSLSKALTPLIASAGKPTVCFVDEFDKLFISGNTNSELAHETTNGVQNEFLKVLESDTASVFHDYGKYVQVSVENVLFVFAGAFNGEEDVDIDKLREFGIKTEFLGRVGLVFGLTKLTLKDMLSILNNSSLLSTYLVLFPSVKKSKVLSEVTSAITENHENNTLGARLINTLLHQYFIYGSLNKNEIKTVSFQKTLELT